MRDMRDDEGRPAADAASREELTLTLLRGFAHDLASPLAVLTSNLPVVRSLPVGDGSADGEQTAAELSEIVDDLELATARLRELTNDLRLYAGASVHDKTFSELAQVALRLAHPQIGRRADVKLDVAPALRSETDASHVLRALCDTLVAIGVELPSATRSSVALAAHADGVTLEIAPGPLRDPTRAIESAVSRLGVRPAVELSRERLIVRIALRWLGHTTR